MMNLWRAAAATLFAFVLVAATAEAASQCVTKSELEAFLARETPSAIARSYGGEDAKVILASLAKATNTEAPAADGLMIVDISPAAPAVKVVVFRNSCLERIGTFPKHLVTRALNDLAKLGA